MDMNVMEIEEKVMDRIVEGPREKLRMILEKNGEAILQDSDRVEGLLRDHCGSYRKEIAALVGALNERVPLELKGSWQAAMTPEAMRARLVQRLEDNRGLASEVAAWAVDTWSYALGIGLGRRSDRLDSVVLGSSSEFQHGAADLGDGSFGQQRAQSDAERQAAIASDRVGGAGAAGLAKDVQKDAEKKKRVGIGVAAAVLIAAVLAFNHSRTPTPTPTPNPVVIVVPPNGGSTQTVPPKPVDPTPTPTPKPVVVPVVKPPVVVPVVSSIAAGTPIEIRLNQAINSANVEVGDTFSATLATPLVLNSKTVLPRGSEATIKVVSIDPGGKVTGQTVMMLSLVQLSFNGKTYRVSAGTFPILGPKQAVEAVKRGGVGGAVGAVGGFVVGKVFHHGGAGAASGGGTGAAIGVATTKTQPAKAAAEQLLHFKLTRPMAVAQ